MWVAERVEGPAIATQSGYKAVQVTFRDKDTGDVQVEIWEVPTNAEFDSASLHQVMCTNGMQQNDIGPCL
jgi:hypothetical protein